MLALGSWVQQRRNLEPGTLVQEEAPLTYKAKVPLKRGFKQAAQRSAMAF